MKRKRQSSYSPQWSSPRKKKKKKSRRYAKGFLFIFLMALIGCVGASLYLLLQPAGLAKSDAYIYITDTTDANKVYQQVERGLHLKHPRIFRKVAELSEVEQHLKQGKYKLSPQYSLLRLVKELKEGEQTPITINIRQARTQQELLLALTENLQMTPTDLNERLQDPAYCAALGFDTITIRCLFSPDVDKELKKERPQLFWNTSPDTLIAHFKRGYDTFWNKERTAKAKQAGLSPVEAIILASIVQEESNKKDEHSAIAGLYLNRLHKGMKLQADPTARYAYGDFSVKRIGRTHIRQDSPYNTYRVVGLPPGPICFPRLSTIDSVLNYKKHNYLYMCAKSDFSGYHAFAATYEEHLKNARLYQKELDRRNIR